MPTTTSWTSSKPKKSSLPLTMAKDDHYNDEVNTMDELALTMKHNLKLKSTSTTNGHHHPTSMSTTTTSTSCSYFNKKHRLSPYSWQENQNRSKSSCVSSMDSVQQCGSSSHQYDVDTSDDVGTYHLLREGSLIKEAVKRLQSKRRHPIHQPF